MRIDLRHAARGPASWLNFDGGRMKIYHILVSLGFLAAVAFAAEPTPAPPKDLKEEPTKREEEKANWPKTVDEAVTRILSTMPEKDRKIVRETGKNDLIKFHHGWGGRKWGQGVRCSDGARRRRPANIEHPDLVFV